MILRLGNIVLAIWVVVASSGFNLNRHFCEEKLKAVTVYSVDKFCEHRINSQKDHCKMHQHQSHEDCCENEKQLFRTDEYNYNKKSLDFSANSHYLTTTYFELNHFSSSTVNPYPKYKNYKPPLPDPDIPILDQAFLL